MIKYLRRSIANFLEFVAQKVYSEGQLPDHDEDEIRRFVPKLIRTMDDVSEIYEGGCLFKRLGTYYDEHDDYESLYDVFYALVYDFNLILNDMNEAIGDLPESHALRKKYTIKPPDESSPPGESSDDKSGDCVPCSDLFGADVNSTS